MVEAKLKRLTQTKTCKFCHRTETRALWPRCGERLYDGCSQCTTTAALTRLFVSSARKENRHWLGRNRTAEQRKVEAKKRAESAGREYKPRDGTSLPQGKTKDLSERNAKQAWLYWLKDKAPDWWVREYYRAKGAEWLNPRLSNAEQYRLRYNTDPTFQLKERMRRQLNKAKKRDGIAEIIRGAIRRGGTSNTVERALGYTVADLMQHLERQFARGMDWSAFMAGEIHIDHIVPQASFDLQDDEEWRACWSLSNLQPLWARDNMAKGSKVLALC